MAVTVLCAIRAALTPINGDPLHAFVTDQQVIDAHLRQSHIFGDDAGKMLIVVADDGDQLFTRQNLDSLRAAKNEIQKRGEVKSATSFIDAYRTEEPGQTRIKTVAQKSALRSQLLSGKVPDKDFKPVSYWPFSASQRSSTNMTDLREEALADNRLSRKLLSTDGTKHSILIAINTEAQLSLPDQQLLCNEVRRILSDHGIGQNGIYLAGLPVVNAAIGDEIISTFTKILPLGFIAVAALIFFIYRDVRVTFLIVLIGIVAVIWSVGITSFVFGEITILVAAMPLVVLAVATTDFLHITTAYQLTLAQSDKSQEQSLWTAMKEVGGACVLTSITTFIGFASLVLTSSAAVQQFGFACAIGTSVALILMVTLLPIAYLRIKPLNFDVGNNLAYQIVDQIIGGCKSLVRRFPVAIVVLTAAVCIPGLWVIYGKPVDADLPNRFPSSHPVVQSIRVLEKDFSGFSSIELYVGAKPEELLSHSTTRKLKEFENQLSTLPSTLSMVSTLDLFQGIEDVVSYRTEDGLPPDAAVAEASLQWIAKIEPDAVDSLITRERDQMRIRVMTRSTGLRETHQLGNELEEILQKNLGSSFTVSAGGTYSLIGNAVNGIVSSQVLGFFFCVFSLTVILIWGLGSWRVAILAQIPNLIPVFLMVGVVAFTLDRIDTDFLALPMIALGIAVDDTIHFLNRYRLALSQGMNVESALETVYQTTGRSIVISSIALSVGLLPLALAQVVSLWMLGTFLVLGIIGALIADLLCLPAMIKLGIIRYRSAN